MLTITVGQTKEYDYNTVSEAVSSLPEGTASVCIKIYPGTYYEKLEIRRGNLTIEGCGDSPEDTELTFDDYARAEMPDGTRRGTFRSYSVFIDASNVTVRNLTISNTSGNESKAWQAIALYADGDNLRFENVRLLSLQDTLFTGPLPPTELQPGGFIGPKQFDPRINGHQYYSRCHISGNVDFIFGSATAEFTDCTIESVKRSSEKRSETDPQGYCTAPSTPKGQKEGYTFKNCTFVSHDCPPESVYLGRPWRDYAKAVFEDCTFGPHIKQEGFHDWNKEVARKTSFFAVKNCKKTDGTPYIPSAGFAHILD